MKKRIVYLLSAVFCMVTINSLSEARSHKYKNQTACRGNQKACRRAYNSKQDSDRCVKQCALNRKKTTKQCAKQCALNKKSSKKAAPKSSCRSCPRKRGYRRSSRNPHVGRYRGDMYRAGTVPFNNCVEPLCQKGSMAASEMTAE